jgi:hypothetical protein
MATTILEILVIVLILLFLVQIASVVYYQRVIKNSPVFQVACAGSEKPDTPKEYKVTNLQWDNFKNENGVVLDAKDYLKFITIGESMLLGGIRSEDIIFVKKVVDNELPTLPAILVLRREQAAMEKAARFNDQAETKIRRSWRVCSLDSSNDTILGMVRDIIFSQKFQEIRRIDETKFPETDWLLADFASRLERYRREHEGCEQDDNDNHCALISTTLDTMQGRVHFSIHSCRTIIGEVKYAFGVNHHLEAA